MLVIFQVKFLPSVDGEVFAVPDDADAFGLDPVVEVRDDDLAGCDAGGVVADRAVLGRGEASWKVKPEGAKSQLSIDWWQLKQFSPVTGIEFAAASASATVVADAAVGHVGRVADLELRARHELVRARGHAVRVMDAVDYADKAVRYPCVQAARRGTPRTPKRPSTRRRTDLTALEACLPSVGSYALIAVAVVAGLITDESGCAGQQDSRPTR